MTLPRVVVTGSDAEGRSTVVGERAIEDRRLSTLHRLAVAGTDAENSGGEVTLVRFRLPGRGPTADQSGLDVPFHATPTVDLIFIASGQVALVTELGETRLAPGDSAVINGHIHAWRTLSEDDVIIIGVSVPEGIVDPHGLGIDRGQA